MSMFILDTDIATLAFHAHPLVLARMGQALATDPVVLSAITIREIFEGRLSQIARARKPQLILDAYDGLRDSAAFVGSRDLVSLSMLSLARYENLLRMRLNVGKDDLRIAAIALEEGATVVTRNMRDFRRVPGLVCEDWSV